MINLLNFYRTQGRAKANKLCHFLAFTLEFKKKLILSITYHQLHH